MTARTHDLIAFGALLTVSVYYPPAKLNVSTLVAVLIGNTVGALIPDMDQATNRLWDLLPAGNLVGKILRKLMLSHRTISHSILGCAILFWLVSTFLPKILNPTYIDINLVTASLMIGFVSHLLADALTKDGIPLLFPIKINFGFPPFKFLRLTTGKFVEKFVVFPSVLVYIFWFTATRKEVFVALLRLIKN
jgi:inner membrane protein